MNLWLSHEFRHTERLLLEGHLIFCDDVSFWFVIMIIIWCRYVVVISTVSDFQ